MSKFVAIKYFEDLTDEGTPYEIGTVFPREGVEVPEERFNELASVKNRRKESLIVKLKELDPKPSKEEVLQDKKIEELKELATEKGLEFDAKIKKNDLVALLTDK